MAAAMPSFGRQLCRQKVIRSLIQNLGHQSSPPKLPCRVHARNFNGTTTYYIGSSHEATRGNASTVHHAQIDGEKELSAKTEDLQPTNEELDRLEAASKSPSTTESHVPWYLQVQKPVMSTTRPMQARQRLPDLPSNSPQILQPILQHVSVELGMDDLSLLDLRRLDPPPALGSNLLMIIGTARSEKHLHVSADRFCRWLRTTYKLRPYADGLLGRNELKLKLRRHAKKTRMLSAVGAKSTAETEIDDGIRTGWVCVNVGRVDGGDDPLPREQMPGVIGFGSEVRGCNIVVQMLTEEKRGDMDLEKLWTGILRRSLEGAEDPDNVDLDGTISEDVLLSLAEAKEPEAKI